MRSGVWLSFRDGVGNERRTQGWGMRVLKRPSQGLRGISHKAKGQVPGRQTVRREGWAGQEI